MTTNNPPRVPARIALLHHTGGGNLGDDAIVECIIDNIRRRWPAATVAVISMNPVIRLPRAVFSELAFLVASGKRIKTFDAMILGGGGQLTDRSGPWGFPYAIFTWFLLAKSARLKCVVLNTGAGPVINRLSKVF